MIGYRNSHGFSLIEVMVTCIILAIALLGLAGLQARALTGEYESFSRGQALLLVNDMADRIAANRTAAIGTDYGQTSEFGVGHVNACADTSAYPTAADQSACCATTHAASVSARDLCEWDLALKGVGQSNSIGSVIGARGCVTRGTTAPYLATYQIDVVWQGKDNTGSVASDVSCGSAAITSSRRAVSRRVGIPRLEES